jgi:hypothetical protein
VVRNLEDTNKALHGLVYGLLTVTHAQLESVPCDIILPTDLDIKSDDYAKLVIERQEKLAMDFRSFMTTKQSFESVNDNRQEFYTRVVEAAKAVNLHLFHHFCNRRYISSKFCDQCKPGQYLMDNKGVRTAGEILCRFVDPKNALNVDKWRRPLVILSFDEPFILIDGAKEAEWSLYSELCRILQRLDTNPIFSLFLSTAWNFRLLSPDMKHDPSSRVTNERLRPFHPITEISYDCLAKPAKEDSFTLDQVTQMDWIAHLGRPLYVPFVNCLGNQCLL